MKTIFVPALSAEERSTILTMREWIDENCYAGTYAMKSKSNRGFNVGYEFTFLNSDDLTAFILVFSDVIPKRD